MSVAEDNVFFTGQAVQSYRSTCVQFIGRNTNFCSQTIFEAVSKTGGSVNHDRAGVHFTQKLAGMSIIFSDDRISVLRAIAGNVLDRLLDIRNKAYAQNRSQIYGTPVVFAREFCAIE